MADVSFAQGRRATHATVLPSPRDDDTACRQADAEFSEPRPDGENPARISPFGIRDFYFFAARRDLVFLILYMEGALYSAPPWGGYQSLRGRLGVR